MRAFRTWYLRYHVQDTKLSLLSFQRIGWSDTKVCLLSAVSLGLHCCVTLGSALRSRAAECLHHYSRKWQEDFFDDRCRLHYTLFHKIIILHHRHRLLRSWLYLLLPHKDIHFSSAMAGRIEFPPPLPLTCALLQHTHQSPYKHRRYSLPIPALRCCIRLWPEVSISSSWLYIRSPTIRSARNVPELWCVYKKLHLASRPSATIRSLGRVCFW